MITVISHTALLVLLSAAGPGLHRCTAAHVGARALASKQHLASVLSAFHTRAAHVLYLQHGETLLTC